MASLGQMRSIGQLLVVVVVVSMVGKAVSCREPARHGRSLQAPYMDLGDVVVANVSAFGSGCPNSSTTATLSWNNSLLSIQTDFQVEVPIPGRIPLARSACVVIAQLIYPVGWVVAPSYWDTYGAVKLDKGLVGIHTGEFYYQGGPTLCNTTMTANATESAIPEKSYTMSAMCDANATWSGCAENRGLVFHVTQRIYTRPAPLGEGYMRGFALFARLGWKWCGDTLA